MLKQFAINYGEKKLLRTTNTFDIIWAHQARTAIKNFHKRHPNVVIHNVYVEYDNRKVYEWQQ